MIKSTEQVQIQNLFCFLHSHTKLLCGFLFYRFQSVHIDRPSHLILEIVAAASAPGLESTPHARAAAAAPVPVLRKSRRFIEHAPVVMTRTSSWVSSIRDLAAACFFGRCLRGGHTAVNDLCHEKESGAK